MSTKVLLPLAARTATPTIADQSDPNAEGLHVIINVTAVTATPSVVPTLQGKGPLGTYYDLLVGTAITATGTTVLKLGPGIAPVANGAAADYLPDIWRVVMTHGDADSITYSVTAVLAE
jgi:hypothetical protein